MSIDFQKVADAIEKSSQEIKNLMFSTELGEKILEIAEKNNLIEEEYLRLADEIGYVILNLKPRNLFFDSLKESGINENAAKIISNAVESEIFVRLNDAKNETGKSEPEKKQAQNGVGQSFEQIILNQARAMQPARQAPTNLPTNEPLAEEKPKAIHNYIGSDPYREPIG